ncbi:hypothetical protein FF1_006067 [Malus domestica]
MLQQLLPLLLTPLAQARLEFQLKSPTFMRMRDKDGGSTTGRRLVVVEVRVGSFAFEKEEWRMWLVGLGLVGSRINGELGLFGPLLAQ